MLKDDLQFGIQNWLNYMDYTCIRIIKQIQGLYHRIIRGFSKVDNTQLIHAVIDFGTNTCNLLIAENNGVGTFRVLYEERIVVIIGHGSIRRKKILPEAMEKGLSALTLHEKNIYKYGAKNIRVIATSAIRDASNKFEFIDLVQKQFGWRMEVIDGSREAEYIFRGTVNSIPHLSEKFLVLDIGGGSNEFILAEGDNIIWKKSFNIGVARVMDFISISDPPVQKEIEEIENWYNDQLNELVEICCLHQPRILVGCSAAFDTIKDIQDGNEPDTIIRNPSSIPLNEFYRIHNLLISVDCKKRCQINGIDYKRAEMIIIASIFINLILHKLQIRKLIHTHCSLKEGIMFEMISHF